ncbi:MAG: ABC transporter ATP-binding protein [Bacteroidia bacterium]|nr:ABC transporter ATP-binding protein [Bacteroidota bacterium]MBP6413838.1 ABC transporter ATP-binding protein [Bacteroidia bacterium]
MLEIKNLRTEFRTENETVTAVNGISFSVNKGETIGIVGESGSGKSVTSLSLMRLIASPPGKITGGEMLFNSATQGTVDLATLSEKQLRKLRGNEIAMIFQEPMTSLNPVYTCGNQVMESLLLHKNLSSSAAKARTIELFKEVQLPRPEQLFDSYPHQLSGGQKQRVMIAMAISCNPSLLIADEPTTALDVTVQKSILELLQKLQQQYQMGILFITHDLGVIAELADKVIVMYRGSIVEQGAVKDIFTKPQHPYTKGLLACRPPMHVRLKRLPVVSDFMITDTSGLLVENKASVTDLTQQLVITDDERAARLSKLYAQEPLLQLKNLKTYFPISKGIFGKVTDYVKAVDSITFDVYPGETLGLVGESGCGKTTLGRSILRLVEPTAGEIIYKGVNIRNLSYEEMRKMRKEMQLIFQDPYSSLNPRLTIGKAIMEPMQVHKVLANDHDRKNKVIELLERVSMSEKHFNRYPHEFSGGQRQRICIARALALSPKFIICDESVSALDVSVQAQVLNLLNELRAEFGFTYIFISHDLSVVKFMSDRMVVMNKGVIEEMGDADAIYNHPQSEYTKKLISAIPKGISSVKPVNS